MIDFLVHRICIELLPRLSFVESHNFATMLALGVDNWQDTREDSRLDNTFGVLIVEQGAGCVSRSLFVWPRESLPTLSEELVGWNEEGILQDFGETHSCE